MYTEAVKTTVEIPDPLLEEAKAFAAEHQMTFRMVLETALRKVLQENRKPARAYHLRDGSFKGGKGIAPGMDWKAVRERIYEGRGE